MYYSGTSTFEFEIERFKNRQTCEIVDDSHPVEYDSFEYFTVTLQVTGSSFFQSGKYYGPPESCYPDDGDTALESAVDETGKDWSNLLTDSEVSSILNAIEERVMNDPGDFEDDYEPESGRDHDDWDGDE